MRRFNPLLLGALMAGSAAGAAGETAGHLPPGARAVWDLSSAYRETAITRERVCLNGLWRWQPATPSDADVPGGGWGYFKVPGSWPGITSYMQKDSQRVHRHPDWPELRLSQVAAAWYEREMTVPAEWSGRRIGLSVEYLNSFATVFVDGERAGELRFPAGELDLTGRCHPGERHVVSLLVKALPLRAVMLTHSDSAAAREVTGTVARRGLCGDVFLASAPEGARLTGTRVATSVRQGEITLEAGVEDLEAGKSYTLAARILDSGSIVKTWRSGPFQADELDDGRAVFTERWRPDKLWDIHTPGHQYEIELSLLDAEDQRLDVLPPVRFGFREFWIEGRDFYLNGSRVFLSAVPLDNAQVGPALATYAAARESLERLRSFGINFVYTHNYDCLPGAHLSFAEILRAADDVGMLVALSQPHFSHYEWTATVAADNGYARHAEFYARVAGNHPSVVMYATSHNATGYNEDMNPDLMDGRSDRRDTWAANNTRRALQAEAVIRSLDPHRIIYHHASGNLGPLHASNFYPNFVPVQEMSDWFEPWATRGVKPLFLCEYGAPFTWDWAMYRGWHEGKREFGSAAVPWEFCLAEWNAQFFGDRAFVLSEMERRNLRWESRRFRAGGGWHRWDYPHALGSTDFAEREPVFARYFASNWRAFRTWGLSANSPWEHHILFKLRPGITRNRREELPVDWANLQRPGFSPDFLGDRYERMDLAYERSDWLPTEGAEALMRNNLPLLAYLGGKPARVTSQDHLFVPGETFEKQLIVINNSRETVRARSSWVLALPQPITGQTNLFIETGEQARVPLEFTLPEGLEPGDYRLSARVEFDPGGTQEDEFLLRVLPRPQPPALSARIALFDPSGETAGVLQEWSVPFTRVDHGADLAGYDLLVVGRGALTVDGPAPDIHRVRTGLRVLVFEQRAAVLEKRFGFRVAEYGLRNVFVRVPEHPVLAHLGTEHLRDWRGEATLVSPRLQYETSRRFNGAPTVEWCGIPVTRAWRAGCQGNVASVLIEKPARGDFLPILEGGFSLQYSPLLEYREGAGLVLFCQLDVTGRSERDPVAETLFARLIEYAATWSASPAWELFYAGATAGRSSLEAAGFQPGAYLGGKPDPHQLLVVGPGGDQELGPHRDAIAAFLKAGGRLLALGLDEAGADAFLPFPVSFSTGEHINAFFDPPSIHSPLSGVGPADVHCRDPRELSLVSGGALAVGNGVLGVAANGQVVFCQLLPWEFDYAENFGLKRTYRRIAFLLTRLLSNLGARAETPLLARWSAPVQSGEPGRWLDGLYLDEPEEWDDPYRFFRW